MPRGPQVVAERVSPPQAFYRMNDEREWRLRIDGDDIGVALQRASAHASNRVFVFAHGAGGHMADRAMLATAQTLRERGVDVLRFNFPYSEKRSRRPDPMPRLMATIASVVALARDELRPGRLLIGGRSMGGRAASMLAADGFDADGLLLLAYPLHPAGQPEKLRAAHLARITMPVLCINGTRDALCTRELMDRTVSALGANWRMHWLDGADHAFHVTKASGRSDAGVLDDVASTVERWLASLGG